MEIGNLLHGIVFYIVAAVSLGGALVTARAQNLIYSAMGLLFALLGVAGVFVFAHADFVAIIEIVVYVGGILVLMLFGIMLTRRIGDVKVPNEITGGWKERLVPAIITLVLLGTVLSIDWADRFPDEGINPHLWSTYDADAPDNVENWPEMNEITDEGAEPSSGDSEQGNRDIHQGTWGTLDTIGKNMMNKYLMAFEEISVLLLIALLGAAFLARRRSQEELEQAQQALRELEA